MDGVTAQQAGSLDQVGVPALAHHDRPQAQALAAPGVFNENAGQQPPNPAKAVQDHVRAGCIALALAVNDPGQFGAQEFLAGEPCSFLGVLEVQHGKIDGGRTEIQRGQRLQQGQGFFRAKQNPVHVAGEAVGFEQADRRLVDQAASVD